MTRPDTSSDYRRAAIVPILNVGLATLAFICIKSARDSVFLSSQPLLELPLAYLAIAVTSIPAAMIHIAAITRWGVKRTRVGVLLLSAIAFLFMAPLAEPGGGVGGTVLFVLVPVIFAAIFAAVWLASADRFEHAPRDAKRWIYSWIGASSLVGGMLGGLTARSLSPFVSSAGLMVVGSGIVFMVFVLTFRSAGTVFRVPASRDRGEAAGQAVARRPEVFKGIGSLLKSRYVIALATLSAVIALTGVLIDFQFYAYAKISGNTAVDFFGGIYTILYFVGVVLQLIVAPWIQGRVGVQIGIMLLPVSLLGATAVVAVSATLATRTALKVVESGLKNSLHRSIWEQAYLPISPRHRDIAKTLVDGMFARAGEMMGAVGFYLLLLYFGVENLPFSWLLSATVIILIPWLGVNLYLLKRGCGHAEGDGLIRLVDT